MCNTTKKTSAAIITTDPLFHRVLSPYILPLLRVYLKRVFFKLWDVEELKPIKGIKMTISDNSDHGKKKIGNDV